MNIATWLRAGWLAFVPVLSFASPDTELSEYASAEARAAWENQSAFAGAGMAQLDKQKARYAVSVHEERIGGVNTEVFVPEKGVRRENETRVLINLHGGGFVGGSRVLSGVESIPIASVGRIKVVSVDYRLAPEAPFPAATDDVVAVYRALLENYRPQNVGIYGCDAGGTLTAQVVARLIRDDLPLPGAVGLFCADLNGVAADDPLIAPMRHPDLVRAFPPSLFVTGTRSPEMSSVLAAHKTLSSLGVESQLLVWDGLIHAFIRDPDLPESREAYEQITRFFALHLGRARFEDELTRFLRDDLRHPPAACGLLFVGSSSIRRWRSLAEDMAPLPVMNRGFGGSTIAEINDYFDRVVTPYHPRAIFFYAGDNDIAGGRKPEEVVADFRTFLDLKRRALGAVPVYFISVKPSKSRLDQIPLQAEVNAGVRKLARSQRDLKFIDVVAAMMDNGVPRDLYVADGLHMTDAGYRIWTDHIRPAALAAQERPSRCARPLPSR